MQRFVEKLHAAQQRVVPIVDPGIKLDPGYDAYDDGLRRDVFIRDVSGSPYIGQACHVECVRR